MFLSKYGDWLLDRGINIYRVQTKDIKSAKAMITKYYVFYRYKK